MGDWAALDLDLPFLVGFLVLLPFAIAAIRILSWDSGSPLGDWAALDLDVRSGPAFLGSYSQYGFRSLFGG
jgi:hypothetical protein